MLFLLNLLRTLVWLMVASGTAATSYIAGLSLVALWPRQARQRSAARAIPATRFAILVPAHNEELTLGPCLASLQKLDYPAALYRIFVVADNCTDLTAAIAQANGATVYERHDETKKSKGYALEWLLEQLRLDGHSADAYVFLDADSTTSPNLLAVAADALAAGAEVLQTRYTVANPDDSWRAALRYTAMAAINYARPLGRQHLGLSAGLKGTGMIFRAEALQALGWHSYTRAEDAEMHLQLLLQGRRVEFLPECVVLSAMPATGQQARSQEMRWEGGRLEMARRFVPLLLKEVAVKPSSYQKVLLDGAIEVSIPPISILAGLSAAGTLAGWLLRSRAISRAALLGLLELVVYVLASLLAIRAPLKTYAALAFAPFFVVWKVALYARVLLNRRQEQAWVRTERVAQQK